MDTETTRIEKSRDSVRRWYARHREEYAELRRKRYRSDPKLRAKARRSAARYRKERQQGLKVQRTLRREVNGISVEVFTSGYIADRAGCSPQVLRGWETRGWIPPTIFPNEKHRLYTARQVALIRLLADALKANDRPSSRRKKDAPVLDEVINLIHKTWKVVDHGDQGSKKAPRGRRRN
jgi:MerR HTH family regulatory protein